MVDEFKGSFEYRLRKSDQKKMRERGESILIPKDAVIQRITELRQHVSMVRIARDTGVPRETIYSWVYTASRTRVYRMYADRIMKYEVPADALSLEERHRGAQRIYRGLACRGFTMEIICDQLDYTVGSFKNVVCGGEHVRRGFSPDAYEELKRIAGKLETQNAYDLAPSKSVNVVKGKARGQNWVDIGAWDMDEVHRADAYPDRTGQCGRMAGAMIHLRQGQPLCRYCEHATTNAKNKIDPYKLYDLYLEGEHTHSQMAQLLGVTKDLVDQYVQFLSPEEKLLHTLTNLDKVAKTAYCSLCRGGVQVYVTGRGRRYACANQIREYRKGRPNDHGRK